MAFQKRTQVREGEHTSLQQGSPVRRAQLRDILQETALRVRSRLDRLGGGIWKPSSCAVTLDATGQQNYHGMHPEKSQGHLSILS